jgi:hypothetical protein
MSDVELRPQRSDAAQNRRRFKIVGWAVIILILGASGLILWHRFGAVGAWELVPLTVAMLIGWISYKRAISARNR